MRTFIVVFFVVFVISCQEKEIEFVSMQEDVAVLASDSLLGREAGTDGERMAAEYLAKRFEDLQLIPKGNEGYYQKFSFKKSTNPHEEDALVDSDAEGMSKGMNVVGYIDNKAENTVIIGAHFDHLGMGGAGSLYREGKEIHNGADDNASGVSAMLSLAYRLQDANKSNNYLLIAFSGEEKGLLGSNYFVKNPSIDLEKATYMINMDMIGRLNEEKEIAVHGIGTSPVFKQTLFANNEGFTIAEHESGVGPSDHTSFYLNDIPVLHFFTGQHADYHKPTDDAETLNYEGLQEVTDYVFRIITDLDNDGKLEFRKTKNETENTPEFKVTLGVIPDYLYTGQGMRIDGVSEDRPAQRAGMQKGDIVMKMSGYPITDMMSYMKSLSVFDKGQTIIVTIDRGGEELELEVTF